MKKQNQHADNSAPDMVQSNQEVSLNTNNENIAQWHPAYCSAMELELREDKDILEYEREHNLGKMPLKIDFLVIKKQSGTILKNEIGKFFRGYNITEYKSPGYRLDMDSLYRAVGYACLYKSEGGGANGISDTDITVSLIREGVPKKLLKQLRARCAVRSTVSGIYRVEGMLFPVQIVATKELDFQSHVFLKALTKSLTKDNAMMLINTFSTLRERDDRLNAESVINIAVRENGRTFIRILKEEGIMNEALKELRELILPEYAKLKILYDENEAKYKAEIANMAAGEIKYKAEIADKEAEIADKEAEIADKEAEIELLKRRLAEVMSSK